MEIIEPSVLVVEGLTKQLNLLVATCDLKEQLPICKADAYATELLAIVTVFNKFSLDFKKNHMISLFSQQTGNRLREDIKMLMDLRIQWAYINYKETASQPLSPHEVAEKVTKEISVQKCANKSKQVVPSQCKLCTTSHNQFTCRVIEKRPRKKFSKN